MDKNGLVITLEKKWGSNRTSHFSIVLKAINQDTIKDTQYYYKLQHYQVTLSCVTFLRWNMLYKINKKSDIEFETWKSENHFNCNTNFDSFTKLLSFSVQKLIITWHFQNIYNVLKRESVRIVDVWLFIDKLKHIPSSESHKT